MRAFQPSSAPPIHSETEDQPVEGGYQRATTTADTLAGAGEGSSNTCVDDGQVPRADQIDAASAAPGNSDLRKSILMMHHARSRSSTSAGKRKFSAISPPDEMDSIRSSLSPNANMPSSSSSAAVNQLDGIGTPPGVATNLATVPRASNKITTSTAMVHMNSSIHRLTDIFERAMTAPQAPQDSLGERRNQAIQMMQDAPDEFSTDEKVVMISLFMKDPVAADTYCALTDMDVRRSWVRKMVEAETRRD
jgi:hypothetical protein